MAENEIKNGDRPEITISVDNVEEYDTVFVGYPIWYDEAPAMISTFLASYNFEGKRLIPFCTSSSDIIDISCWNWRYLYCKQINVN
ncbi:flavodoxin [Lachnospiraceae bacterium KM106-2]|nr:flavodoxin [Lachnospiraceae bacterium KM106-2]